MKPQQQIAASFEQFFEGLAALLIEKLTEALPRNTGSRRLPSSSMVARNGVDMRCRVEGCKERSRGPRNRFMCEAHKALPKEEQLAHLAAYKAAQS